MDGCLWAGVDFDCYLEVFGTLFLSFAAVEIRFNIDVFSEGKGIHREWGVAANLHPCWRPYIILSSDCRAATSSFETDDC